MAIEHVPVQSSMITSVGHDEEKQELQVKFKNGKIYHYGSVSVDEFESLRDAESVGKHFNENFRERRS